MVLIPNTDPLMHRLGPLPPVIEGRRVGHAAEVSFQRPDDILPYEVGDAVSHSTTEPGVLHFANCARREGSSGLVTHASLAFDEMVGAPPGPPLPPQLLLLIFSELPESILDNDPIVPTTAEVKGLLFFVRFETDAALTYGSGGVGHTYYEAPLTAPRPFTCTKEGRDLFGLLQVEVVNGWVPMSETKFLIRLGLQMD